MISYEEVDEFLLISEGYDIQDLGLVVFTIKRFENILRNHFVKDTAPSQLTFGQLVKCCDLDRGMKASLFLLGDIRNDLVHSFGRYSFSSTHKRMEFITKSNKLIKQCARRVNKPVFRANSFEGFSPEMPGGEGSDISDCATSQSDEDAFRDFYKLLASFPDLKHKIEIDEDNLYKDTLHPGCNIL